MDKFKNKSDLYILTDIELQSVFKMATLQLNSKDVKKVKSAQQALNEIKTVQRSKIPKP